MGSSTTHFDRNFKNIIFENQQKNGQNWTNLNIFNKIQILAIKSDEFLERKCEATQIHSEVEEMQY